MSVGSHQTSYDSMLVLTHFREPACRGGFGRSNKNIGIGCADGRIGKAMIHTYPGQGQWSIAKAGDCPVGIHLCIPARSSRILQRFNQGSSAKCSIQLVKMEPLR